MSLYVKNTYPPPCNRIRACYVIQSFCFEPTGNLLKGIVIRDVGDEQRSALSMYSLKFLNFYTLIRQPQHPALVTTRSVPRRSISIHQTVLSLLLYYHPSTSEFPRRSAHNPSFYITSTLATLCQCTRRTIPFLEALTTPCPTPPFLGRFIPSPVSSEVSKCFDNY